MRSGAQNSYIFRYVPEIIVYHPARASFRELCVKWDRHIQYAVNASDHARWVLRALAFLVSPAVDWTKVVTSHRVHGLLPSVKAIGVLAASAGEPRLSLVLQAWDRGQYSRSFGVLPRPARALPRERCLAPSVRGRGGDVRRGRGRRGRSVQSLSCCSRPTTYTRSLKC